jgi:hypothetical protein
MATAEERMRILQMVQEGQISAEEGASLLSALGGQQTSAYSTSSRPAARWLRVRVTDLGSGKNKVNVTIPMGLVNVGIKMGARFVPETAEVDFKELAEQIQSGVQGKVLDVTDEEDGERVEIFVE